jgi:hypothetical protein
VWVPRDISDVHHAPEYSSQRSLGEANLTYEIGFPAMKEQIPFKHEMAP